MGSPRWPRSARPHRCVPAPRSARSRQRPRWRSGSSPAATSSWSQRSADPTPFAWHRTAEEIFDSPPPIGDDRRRGRPDRKLRRQRGKDDITDAEGVARSVIWGQATGIPKSADGNVERRRRAATAPFRKSSAQVPACQQAAPRPQRGWGAAGPRSGGLPRSSGQGSVRSTTGCSDSVRRSQPRWNELRAGYLAGSTTAERRTQW
jgi:hypothetical protein